MRVCTPLLALITLALASCEGGSGGSGDIDCAGVAGATEITTTGETISNSGLEGSYTVTGNNNTITVTNSEFDTYTITGTGNTLNATDNVTFTKLALCGSDNVANIQEGAAQTTLEDGFDNAINEL